MKRARVNLGVAIIAVDVRRFGHAINTDEVFGTHSLGSSCDGRVRVDFRSKLGNQKLPFDGREAGFAPNCACWRPEYVECAFTNSSHFRADSTTGVAQSSGDV